MARKLNTMEQNKAFVSNNLDYFVNMVRYGMEVDPYTGKSDSEWLYENGVISETAYKAIEAENEDYYQKALRKVAKVLDAMGVEY